MKARKNMTRKYFGTDGIRGKTGEHPITSEFFVKLGYAAGMVLAQNNNTQDRPSVVIGKDTRISGYILESALEAGFASAGVDVLLTGPLPTPAIAYQTQLLGAQAGVVISASHNSYEDNGVKFFSSQGTKLSEKIESEIEYYLEKEIKLVSPELLGKAKRLENAASEYINFCKKTVSGGFSLKGLKIILDCAHGATYNVAPKIFTELGAEVITINNKPNGLNINENAGSIHPQIIQKTVLDNSANLGIAFDGDGDRVIMVDDKGNIVDGDQLLFLIMKRYVDLGNFKGGVVGTLMTNLAFEEKCIELSIPFERASVGDRYVSEFLREKKWLLGGENSGHILMLDKHSTGDGIISALQVLTSLLHFKKTLYQALQELPLYPQVLINIPLKEKINFNTPEMKAFINKAKEVMKGKGRVLIRNSGTQAILRVMAEGPVEKYVKEAANLLVKKIKEEAKG
jgi:phosphoglucosamine mutase